jgi:hypothetical protein
MSSDPDATHGSDAVHEHDVDDDLAQVVGSLSRKFPDVAEAAIAEQVEQARAPLADAPIQDFVPVLVEHVVQVHLNEVDQTADGTPDASASEDHDIDQ